MLVKEWMTDWLNSYVKPTNKAHTYFTYSVISEKHIYPTIGDYELNQLKTMDIQKWVSDFQNENYSSSTIRLCYGILKSALSVAYENGLIEKTPCQRIRVPALVNKEVTVFTKAEQKKLETAVYASGDKRELGFIISLYTGIRIGELLALKWENVDMENGFLYIRSTVYNIAKNGKEETIYDAPKTTSSRRKIPFGKNVLKILKELKKDKSDFVISSNGKPVNTRTYQALFKRFLIKNGLPTYKFHTLRHTFATRALELGIDVKTISELLGHRNASITLMVYSHSLMESKILAIKKVSEIAIKD